MTLIFIYMQIPNTDIKHRCKLHGFPRYGTIVDDEVIVIGPLTIIRNSILRVDKYEIALMHVIESITMLFNPYGYYETIAKMGIGGFVVCLRTFLEIV